jgi:hypothetical protein
MSQVSLYFTFKIFFLFLKWTRRRNMIHDGDFTSLFIFISNIIIFIFFYRLKPRVSERNMKEDWMWHAGVINSIFC